MPTRRRAVLQISASASRARSPRSSPSSPLPTSRWSAVPWPDRRRTARWGRRSTSAIPTATCSNCSRSTAPPDGLAGLMDFTESDEHAMLRAAAGDVAASFGHEWFRDRARAGGRAEELWQALAAPGFLSVHLPERYGGGGGGMSELVVVS